MNDILKRVGEEKDFLKKILEKIPGFNGYVERVERRLADKLLRESIAEQFEALWGRISAIQRKAISDGNIELIDELEAPALKLRQFIDRIRTASYGYAGFFDAIKVKTEELNEIYKYDYVLLALGEEVAEAVDNVELSMGSNDFTVALGHLTKLAQDCIDAFEKRKDVIVSMSESSVQPE